MNADSPTRALRPQKRPNWRLRVLLAVAVLGFCLHAFIQLDRSTASLFGRLGEGIHDTFNSTAPTTPSPSAAAQRFTADVKALGGSPSVFVQTPGFLGIFGRSEHFNALFRNSTFDDAALARLSQAHGDQILNLHLENTGVSDAGLRHLKGMTKLRHLVIRQNARTRGEPSTTMITDAGLIHLGGLTQLWSINLDGLPITDDGVAELRSLPSLIALYLSNTKVKGRGLAGLKSLPMLSLLYLDGNGLTDDGLGNLAGATNLQFLSLSGVPLTPKALPLLSAIPRLNHLEVKNCGLLEEDIDALKKGNPLVKVQDR